MNVVLDTNVLVSAVLSADGCPAEIVELLLSGKVKNFVTVEILTEVEEVLKRPSILKRVSLTRITHFLAILKSVSETVEPTLKYSVVKADPDDDKFLDCAVISNAKIIVTGDVHLLNVQEFQGIQILTPRTFLDFFEKISD